MLVTVSLWIALSYCERMDAAMNEEATRLASQLASDDDEVRRAGAEQLSYLGADAQPAAVALVRAAGDRDELVREYVVAALEELGPPTKEDVTALAELLASDEADVAYWAATLLGRLETAGESAAAMLAAALVPERPLEVRQRAAWALGKIGPAARDTADEALRQAAASGEARLSRLASAALQQIESRP